MEFPLQLPGCDQRLLSRAHHAPVVLPRFQGSGLRATERGVLHREQHLPDRFCGGAGHAALRCVPFARGRHAGFCPLSHRGRGHYETGGVPPSTAAAVVRNRDQLRSITEAWLAAFPTNPDAIEAHARALESLGELRDDRPPVRSALLLYRDGRSVAADADQRTRLELGQLRVLLKLGRFEAARALADSLLPTYRAPVPPPRWRWPVPPF
jgi:hypothetical protein